MQRSSDMVYSVSKVNAYIKNMFMQDFVLNKISVEGEVSNCTYAKRAKSHSYRKYFML